MNAMNRRRFIQLGSAGIAAGITRAAEPQPAGWRPRYVLSTSIYGNLPVADLAAEVKTAGCDGLDVWAGRWGNQREQVEAMGLDAFRAVLARHGTRVACFTCMDTGMLKAEAPLRMMHALGGDTVVALIPGGGARAKELQGDALKAAIRETAEKLKPVAAAAGELGVKLAIENHSGGLLAQPEAIVRLVEAIPDRHVGLAFAPYHLPQDPALLGRLVGEVGERIHYFYAWQHGDGSGDIPPAQQRRQLPGVGPLDFKPMFAALKRQRYRGWTSIFMHPTPRGSPMHPTVGAVTAELNRARAYLDQEIARA